MFFINVYDLIISYHCSYSVVGPTTWNGLPIDLRHLQNGACSQFHHLLAVVLKESIIEELIIIILIFVFQISGCQTAPWFTMCAMRPP